MLLGLWRNIEDLENSLCLEELEAIIKASREKEHRHQKFMAALKGIDLDENDEAKERFEAVKRRAEARMTGKSEEQLELAEFGLEIVEE